MNYVNSRVGHSSQEQNNLRRQLNNGIGFCIRLELLQASPICGAESDLLLQFSFIQYAKGKSTEDVDIKKSWLVLWKKQETKLHYLRNFLRQDFCKAARFSYQ